MLSLYLRSERIFRAVCREETEIIYDYKTMKKLFKYILYILLFFFLSTLSAVIVYRYMPVYYTPLMAIRSWEYRSSGRPTPLRHHWVPIEQISPYLVSAVIAGEDGRFFRHSGFDTVEIKKALRENKTRKRPRGASTISQQTAKNVFLWPASSWVRKGLEAYFTVLIEFFWSKERILEVYLNSIEMGPGIYGAHAAAQYYFSRTPDRLTREQSALLAAVLPNPRRYSVKNPTSYVWNRQRLIIIRMGDAMQEYKRWK